MKVEKTVLDIIANNVGFNVSILDSLEGNLGMDSLDIVEVILDLETEFGVNITDEIGSGWITVKDIIKSVTKILGDRK